jgi:hypothetical protein
MTMTDREYAIAMLTASIASDITADDQLRRDTFPGHFEDHYGWVEIFSSCVSLAESLVNELIETHGCLDAFWDEWNHHEGRYRRPGVFEYDAAAALLAEVAERGGDVVYFDDVAREAHKRLHSDYSPVATDSLTAHITHILKV